MQYEILAVLLIQLMFPFNPFFLSIKFLLQRGILRWLALIRRFNGFGAGQNEKPAWDTNQAEKLCSLGPTEWIK